ncbi:hypothetical protein MASR2M78_00570 [Treponema sp.]
MFSRDSFVRRLLPSIIGAAACVGFARSGFLAPFFLVPLALTYFRFGVRNAWFLAFMATIANIVIAAISALSTKEGYAYMADALYFAIATLSFAWALLQMEGLLSWPTKRIAYRLSIAAIITSLALLPVIYLASQDAGLIASVRKQAEAFAQMYADAAGADVVQRSLVETTLTADTILATVRSTFARGAAVASHLVFFFMSWRVAQVFASFSNRALRGKAAFTSFKLDFFLIWVLMGAALSVLAGSLLKLSIIEIVAWNILVLSLLLYASQGYGIVLFNITRPGVPRLIVPLVTISLALLIVRPGINAFVVGGFAALGIAENWLPLRAPKRTDPPSTPEA